VNLCLALKTDSISTKFFLNVEIRDQLENSKCHRTGRGFKTSDKKKIKTCAANPFVIKAAFVVFVTENAAVIDQFFHFLKLKQQVLPKKDVKNIKYFQPTTS
jgi:3D (Asp-Asp-Asp) domain-containing protein